MQPLVRVRAGIKVKSPHSESPVMNGPAPIGPSGSTSAAPRMRDRHPRHAVGTPHHVISVNVTPDRAKLSHPDSSIGTTTPATMPRMSATTIAPGTPAASTERPCQRIRLR